METEYKLVFPQRTAGQLDLAGNLATHIAADLTHTLEYSRWLRRLSRRDALSVALSELRELTQGIRLAILVERGLAAALDDLSHRAALPVRLDVDVGGRLPEQVEAAAYFVASEALANAAKHSHASAARLAASQVAP